MSRKTEHPAGILCKNDTLARIYARQFDELTELRRHICAQLPLRNVDSIFEPGCGTGLLGNELRTLTDASYIGMDIDVGILSWGKEFIPGDAEKDPRTAEIYVTSFFFSSLKNPLKWLRKIRKKIPQGGLFAVFAEYDYTRISELPEIGIADALRTGLEADGISTTNGSDLDFFFEKAGFEKISGGELEGSFQKPDRSFLEMHVKEMPELLPKMLWSIVWGVWSRS